jgi:hypothetical protein
MINLFFGMYCIKAFNQLRKKINCFWFWKRKSQFFKILNKSLLSIYFIIKKNSCTSKKVSCNLTAFGWSIDFIDLTSFRICLALKSTSYDETSLRQKIYLFEHVVPKNFIETTFSKFFIFCNFPWNEKQKNENIEKFK